MPKGAQFILELAGTIFQDVIGTILTSGVDLSGNANIYLALHTAAPTAGDQTNSECAYTGYSRQATVRDVADWDQTGIGLEWVLQNRKSFGLCTAGSETATHWSIGIEAAGAGFVLYYDALSSPISISPGVNPYIDAGTSVEEL